MDLDLRCATGNDNLARVRLRFVDERGRSSRAKDRELMKRAIISCTMVLAIVFVPVAVAAGNGPTKSVYDHKAAKVQHAVNAALVARSRPRRSRVTPRMQRSPAGRCRSPVLISASSPGPGSYSSRWAPASAGSPASHRSRAVQRRTAGAGSTARSADRAHREPRNIAMRGNVFRQIITSSTRLRCRRYQRSYESFSTVPRESAA